ncbi:hypothetical protein Q5424_17825 [Conexibacter sp. JD483]|uniref:hypothetical protein n=1 Tax=unclassified Conexibacter TaxID=2627773 RepID=UPI00271E8B14|nr:MULTISPECIES: hypothetical protein [unclassified Conexibacter]MDO8185729.1 hypothetical protein [Conexibacter sp. CPCC 205706]MDO8199106.1 hypothetical protein [Conexibacter sp. CPCC 205762]MDR9370960.1 hypothetical protein [Conexibacter sp. JD483]
MLRSPTAETLRDGRRGPAIAGAIPQVAVTGDALIDLLDGREPLRFVLTWDGPAAPLARELRARLRGDVIRRDWCDVAELRALTSPEIELRVLPGERADAWAGPPANVLGLRQISVGAWSDAVLTVRAARLTLDGEIDDPSGDLAARRVRLCDPSGFHRRPEALLHLVRLGSRPGWTIEPETLAAARAARATGALTTAPVAHLGAAFELLAAAPEAVAGLVLLQSLAPQVPFADGVEVDERRLREAVAAAPPPAGKRAAEPPLAGERAALLLQALLPQPNRDRVAAFLRGARLVEPYRYVSFENDWA